jgi:hypothetical protein
MVSLSAIIDLHGLFHNIYGIGDNLLHYLAQPRIFTSSFNFPESKRILYERQHPDKLDPIKMAPADVSIFKKRAGLLSGDNEAYRIALKSNPSVEELIAFSFIAPGWSILYPLKHYIMHHMDLAVGYTGFLPYGSAVITFVNTLETKPWEISFNPTHADHTYLQTISNREALAFGMPSVEINNVMYLRGKKILNKLSKGVWENED